MDIDELRVPIVQAPLAGGASTPRLAAAVAQAGGLGFLAAGYKTVAALRTDIEELRSLCNAPFGVNLFAPPATPPSPEAIERYADRLRAEAEMRGAATELPVFVPDLVLSADNAAMIAAAGLRRFRAGFDAQLDINAEASLAL